MKTRIITTALALSLAGTLLADETQQAKSKPTVDRTPKAVSGEVLFARGDCAMVTTSSASYANLQRDAKFAFGVMPMPYYDDINQAPYNTAVGGAGLWALGGKTAAEYKGVAKFFVFLSKPDTQAAWHQKTGYLPLSAAAHELTRKQGYYDKSPGIEVGIKQVTNRGAPTAHSRGVRLGNYAMVRAIIDEELEEMKRALADGGDAAKED